MTRTATIEAQRCDACHHVAPPPEFRQDRLGGMPVIMCVDPVACRRRGEAAGIWRRYP